MKLDLDKSEKKTMFGKTKYAVTARIELTEEEAAIVKKHLKGWKILDMSGIESVSPNAGLGLMKQYGYMLDTYTRSGFMFEFDSIQDLGNYEAALVNGCRQLKQQFEAIASHADTVGKSTTHEF